MSNSEYNNRRRSQSTASRRQARSSRYTDPYEDFDDRPYRETRRSSERTTRDAYRTERSSTSYRRESYEHARSTRNHSSRSDSSNRSQRAAQARQTSQNDSQSRRPLIICIIILLVLDIALAIGIYSCGASLDEQAATRAAQTTPKTSQSAYIIDNAYGLFET